MNLKKNLLFGPALLTVAFQAGAAPAQLGAPHPRVVPNAAAAEASGVAPFNAANLNVTVLALLRQLKTEAVAPRGMVVCEDTYSQKRCRAGLGNGDFEYPNHAESLAGWVLEAGAHSPRPYLGSTPGVACACHAWQERARRFGGLASPGFHLGDVGHAQLHREAAGAWLRSDACRDRRQPDALGCQRRGRYPHPRRDEA